MDVDAWKAFGGHVEGKVYVGPAGTCSLFAAALCCKAIHGSGDLHWRVLRTQASDSRAGRRPQR